MSAIYFHAQAQGEARVSGAERAWMAHLCHEATCSAIGPIFDSPDRPSWVRRMLPEGHYLHRVNDFDFERSFHTYLQVGGDRDPLLVAGEKVDVFSLMLNTALVVGGDVLKLCARLHGQSEVHCYVEGQDRAWLAEIMERGLTDHVFRPKMGWEETIAFLRARADEPVVCSYSVCEQFPNRTIAGWTPPEGKDLDAWYDLPEEERWNMGLARLRAGHPSLRLDPDGWDKVRFGHNLSGFDLFAKVAGKE